MHLATLQQWLDLNSLMEIGGCTWNIIIQCYKHMIYHDGPALPYEITRDTKEEPSFTWKLLAHPGTYIGTISMVFITCIGVYCLKRFWFRPATQRHWPYFPVSSWNAIVDDGVEVTPIYRSGGTIENPTGPFKNHDLHMVLETMRLESHCK